MRTLNRIVLPWIFFTVIIAMFPLAISSNPQLLHQIAPGLLWISILFALMLSMDQLFQQDYQNGILEQMILSPDSLKTVLFTKISTHWLITTLPLILLTPVLAIQLSMNPHEIGVILLTLLLGTPTILFVAAILSALTLNCAQNNVLLSLLLLPLLSPILILGTVTANAEFTLAMLGALFILTITFAPTAIESALKIGLNE